MEGRTVKAESVRNVTSFARYLNSRHGVAASATLREKSFDKKALDWFWENYSKADWQDLCALADWVFAQRQSRPKNIYELVTYHAREAWSEGVLSPKDESVKKLDVLIDEQITTAEGLEDSDASDYWVFRLRQAVGSGRVMVYNEFNQWMKENGSGA